MEAVRAAEILKALSNGADPCTGKVFPPDSPYQQADTVRALLMGVEALAPARQQQKRPNPQPENAGKPWEEDEEKKLISEFEKKMPVPAIAREHKRTVAGINARLEKLGKITLPKAV